MGDPVSADTNDRQSASSVRPSHALPRARAESTESAGPGPAFWSTSNGEEGQPR